jgi:hypothetical protein
MCISRRPTLLSTLSAFILISRYGEYYFLFFLTQTYLECRRVADTSGQSSGGPLSSLVVLQWISGHASHLVIIILLSGFPFGHYNFTFWVILMRKHRSFLSGFVCSSLAPISSALACFQSAPEHLAVSCRLNLLR